MLRGDASEELTQQRLCRHHDGPVRPETIGWLKRFADDRLEGVGSLGLSLEVCQRWREAGFAHLGLDQEPRLAVAHDEEIHLPLLLVAQIAQLKIAEAQVGPAFHRLEQIPGSAAVEDPISTDLSLTLARIFHTLFEPEAGLARVDTLPASPNSRPVARVYDLAMTHQLDSDDYFIHRVQELCAAARLNFFLIEPLWAEGFLQALEQDKVRARVLLNMHSEHHQPEDLYHRLILAAHERGTRVIDPPDLAQAAFDKCRLHPRLVEAGIPVPYSVVADWPKTDTYRLTEEDRAALGTPFVIKPAMGYGRRGLVLDATSEADLERSAAGFANARYLLQRRIEPGLLPDGEPLYFRVFYVFGRTWIAWWNCHTDRYQLPSPEELERHDLARLESISRQIAELTGMSFFSSEIALTPEGQPVVIDYVNDQCHMLSQSSDPQKGVPDALVSEIAEQLVEGARGLLREPQRSANSLAA